MKNIIIFFTIILLFTKASSQESVVYVDIDYIMTNSKVGKNINSQIEKTHKNNISFFEKKENELKKNEQDIIKQKNIIDKSEFQKKINELRDQASEYRKLRKEKIDKVTKQRLNATAKIVKELKSRGYKVNFKEVLKTIKMRDKSDLKRKISPLKRTKDSILIDSSYLTKKQCFKKMKKYIDYKFNKYVKY